MASDFTFDDAPTTPEAFFARVRYTPARVLEAWCRVAPPSLFASGTLLTRVIDSLPGLLPACLANPAVTAAQRDALGEVLARRARDAENVDQAVAWATLFRASGPVPPALVHALLDDALAQDHFSERSAQALLSLDVPLTPAQLARIARASASLAVLGLCCQHPAADPNVWATVLARRVRGSSARDALVAAVPAARRDPDTRAALEASDSAEAQAFFCLEAEGVDFATRFDRIAAAAPAVALALLDAPTCRAQVRRLPRVSLLAVLKAADPAHRRRLVAALPAILEPLEGPLDGAPGVATERPSDPRPADPRPADPRPIHAASPRSSR